MYTHTRKPIYIYTYLHQNRTYINMTYSIYYVYIYIYIYEQKVPSTCGGSSSQDPQRPSPCGFLHLKMPAMQLSMRCCRACVPSTSIDPCATRHRQFAPGKKKKRASKRSLFHLFGGGLGCLK